MKTTYFNFKTNEFEEGICKSANDIMWVEYWIEQCSEQPDILNKLSDVDLDIDESRQHEEAIFAEPYQNNTWICSIDLPLVGETVEAVATTEINAMINASEKASKLIDEYLEWHPELKIRNIFLFFVIFIIL